MLLAQIPGKVIISFCNNGIIFLLSCTIVPAGCLVISSIMVQDQGIFKFGFGRDVLLEICKWTHTYTNFPEKFPSDTNGPEFGTKLSYFF